ncbi:MAG: gamma-glutamylcyclotransferase [Cyanobacteria bacterium P01_G01_bin.67]
MKSASSTLDVFVYGTLKPGYANHAAYCKGKVASSIPAYTWGDLYALPMGYPAMTVGTDKVYGFLLSFNNYQAQILSSLDCLEGYQENRPLALNEYYRISVPVYDQRSQQAIAEAWAYYMTTSRVKNHQGIKVTSGCWTA